MIFILRDTGCYNGSYFIEKFETKEEAMEFIQEINGYIKDFIFIEGEELKLNLEKKGAENESNNEQ